MATEDLPDWSYRIEHVDRSIRYSGDVSIMPEWANEAYADGRLIVRDAHEVVCLKID
jgi:hypothetical protein